MLKHVRQLVLIAAINFATGHSPAMVHHRGGTTDGFASAIAAHAGHSTLSILTYNVKGLPWPVAAGRQEAIDAIGNRLAEFRRSDRQPDVIALQEAFGDTATQIASRAGYRHIAFGPSAEQPAGYRFGRALSRDWSRGEGIGKSLNSGLAILSDYPIASVETLAFGDQACAGFDCLANKGIMKVALSLPGREAAVQIFNTHLNSRKASGVSVGKSNLALRRQLLIAARFVRDHADMAMPVIIAGDFNIGTDRSRRIALFQLSASNHDLGFIRLENAAAASSLARGLVPRATEHADLAAAVKRSKDLVFFSAVRPVAASVPFGTTPDGSSLSDHIGYRIDFAVVPERTKTPIHIAQNLDGPEERKGLLP